MKEKRKNFQEEEIKILPSPEELAKRRRMIYIWTSIFLFLSLFINIGSYFGWFGFVIWGKEKKGPEPIVAGAYEAQSLAQQLLETEVIYATNQIKELKRMHDLMEIAKDARYKKYASSIKSPQPLTILSVAHPTPEELEAINADIKDKNFIELYKIACRLDVRIHKLYRIFRTLELARTQNLDLKEAYESTDVVIPVHPDLNPARYIPYITSTTNEYMLKFKQELETAKTEIKGMISAARSMIDLAAILEPSLLGFGSQWDFAQRQMDILYNIQRLIEGPPTMFIGQTGQDPNAFYHEWGVGEGPITKKELGLPIELGLDLSNVVPLPGRKLLKNGLTAEWMFINSWFVIGPFPNPNRQNLQKKFPPESCIDPRLGFTGIDLDASYIGMNGKPVRWEFVQTDRRVCFIPPQPADWAIWYAYTEIWCDEDQERYCIFGSDDYGKCWINGKEVFSSGITPHPWIPDRGNAKVKFHKGVYFVLCKLENAWGRTGFSLCIYTGKRADTQS